MQVCQKVTIKVTVHNWMVGLWPNGVSGRHLRRNLWIRFLKIYRQSSINGPNVGGTVEFKFKRRYKLQRDVQQITLGNLRTELLRAQTFMNPDLFDLLKVNSLLEKLLEPLRDLWNRTMVAPEECSMDTAVMTAKEAAQAITEVEAPESVEIVAKIPKSPRTP